MSVRLALYIPRTVRNLFRNPLESKDNLTRQLNTDAVDSVAGEAVSLLGTSTTGGVDFLRKVRRIVCRDAKDERAMPELGGYHV